MKKFTMIVDDNDSLTFENEGMVHYEIIGLMQLIMADLCFEFASIANEERKKARDAGEPSATPAGNVRTPDAKDAE